MAARKRRKTDIQPGFKSLADMSEAEIADAAMRDIAAAAETAPERWREDASRSARDLLDAQPDDEQ